MKKKLQYCKVLKSNYLVNHLWTAASENQHQSFRRKFSFLTFYYSKFYNDGMVLSCNMFYQGFSDIAEKL